MGQPLGDDQSLEGRSSHRRRSLLWLNGIGSILIVAGIVGVSVALLSTHRSSANTATGSVGGTPVTREVEAGGLDFHMQVTPGPYFLGEFLVADLSLTNRSVSTFTLAGTSGDSPCGDALYLNTTGGTGPTYTMPVNDIHPCPFSMTQVTPGETLALNHFLPVPNAGNVTLEPGADFLQTTVGPDGVQSTTNGPSPLDGHWPSITISVSPSAPLDRRISVLSEGSQVLINGPAAALAHLYYNYTVTCDAIQGGTVGTGNFAWEPISTTVLREPDCGDEGTHTILEWSYAVSAPGYSIASGRNG
jgi:hypothetical protein